MDQDDVAGRPRLQRALDIFSVPLALLAKCLLLHSGRMLDPDAAVRQVALLRLNSSRTRVECR